jgi:cobalt-zinc-cadmium efflux system protein
MGHHHGNIDGNETKNLKVAFFLNLSFTIVQFIGGFLTNSVAIFSDAIHDLGDSFSLGIGWYLQILSKKDRDAKFSYGYKRYSVLGALINSIILIIGSIFILWETLPRIINPQEVHPQGMIAFALVGIIVNGIAVLKLKKGQSLNEKVVALHLLEDVLGWIAILCGSVVMLFWDLPIIDPILSLIIMCYILYNVVKNIRKILNVFLQRIPSNVDLERVTTYFNNNKFIVSYNDLHIWSLDGSYNVMTVNISVKHTTDMNSVTGFLQIIHEDLKELNIHHCTIEIVE